MDLLTVLLLGVSTLFTCIVGYMYMHSKLPCFLKRLKGNRTTEDNYDCAPFIVEDDNGSTEDFDYTCGICDKDKQIEAVRFCQLCQQFMCYPCSEKHGKFKTCSTHKVISKEAFETISKRRSLFTRPIAVTDTFNIDVQCECTFFSSHSSSCQGRYGIIGAIKLNKHEPFEVVVLGYTSKDAYTLKVLGLKNRINANLSSCVFIKSIMFERKESKVYVCAPAKKQIYWFKSDSKDLTVACETKGECHDIALFNNGFAVSVHLSNKFAITAEWQIHCLSRTWAFERQIVYDKDNKALFQVISGIASSPEGDKLFVSDNEANSVTGLDTLGNVFLKFISTDMASPRRLSVDYEGNVYIACDGKVIQLHSEGKNYREILKLKSQPNQTGVKNVFFDSEHVQLVVVENDEHASVYNFLP